MTKAEEVAKRAGELFESGFNCAESLLVAFAEDLGIECTAFPRLATGFCAGVSRTCSTCGAVSGAVMAIGMKLGRDSATDSNDQCYAAVRRFKEGFARRFGTDNCRELIGCDLGTQEGQETFERRNLKPQCRRYVEVAAGLAFDAMEV